MIPGVATRPLWRRLRSDGRPRYAGEIIIDGQPYAVTLYPVRKRSSRQPDFEIAVERKSPSPQHKGRGLRPIG